MKCKNHSDVDAIVVCVDCGKGFCEDCRVQLYGKNFCLKCSEKKRAPLSYPNQSSNNPVDDVVSDLKGFVKDKKLDKELFKLNYRKKIFNNFIEL